MRIKLFPRLKSMMRLPGALGLCLDSGDSVVGFNCLPGVLSELREYADFKECGLIFAGTNPLNMVESRALASFLKEDANKDKIRLHTPAMMEGWIHALLMETDYNSEALRGLRTHPFEPEKSLINFPPNLRVETVCDDGGFAESLFKVYFKDYNLGFYFCEVANIDAEFPQKLRNADVIVFNLSKFPAVTTGRDDDIDGVVDRLVGVLRRNKVKSAIMPVDKGILLTLPASSASHREYIKENSYRMDIGRTRCLIVRENGYSFYKNSIAPLLVEDESGSSRTLLGLDLGALFHLRLDFSNEFSFQNIVVSSSTYKKVLCAVDVLDQKRDEKIDMIAGRHMVNAINYLGRRTVDSGLAGESLSHIRVLPTEEKKSTRLMSSENLEVLMIPYPSASENYLARIRDLSTGEYLMFTESFKNLLFMEKNLKGINTFVTALESSDMEYINKYSELLKRLQKKHNVQRTLILYSGGTIMSDLEFKE